MGRETAHHTNSFARRFVYLIFRPADDLYGSNAVL